ncbi:isopropylmalate isomerase [Oceanicola sp. 22II-s10i]|uniref:3-isopropylmalate dehydratase large subunit n=1 Tax=Oceanicola sp. 22II-s10i TaxID=1317116 RepID=UPI000B525336|nr:3-isopropylmalate dehydratase large subunit [Oceanicola sp. 22II-s10i]OWU83127.1 isopropylmalate isomerase [Oceanicola sp. 22II-s10i]
MSDPKTIIDKIWEEHEILRDEGGTSLLYVSRHLAHDGSIHAFTFLEERGLTPRRPDRIFATPDHGTPTVSHDMADLTDPDQRRVVTALAANAKRHGFTHFGLGDRRQGIVHVVGPEQGISQPGLVIVCGDSHTSTHGGVGALAFGIGASEVMHVLATQTLWIKKPRTMRITIDGERPAGVTAKDIVLSIIAHIGANGGAGHAIEYAGSLIRSLDVEERLTVCNMSIEAGARSGMIAPDETTFEYLKGKPFAPGPEHWEAAVESWRALRTDEGAVFDREVRLDASQLTPMVTWGNSPEDALPITGRVPDPAQAKDDITRDAILRTLDYMGLTPGMALTDVTVDQVFIGSCTNSRIEDLRAAAAVAGRGRAVVPAMVSPGSSTVKAQAEAEGLDRIFRDAGFEWRESGCSMCVGMNGDLVASGKRCASTTNRNFRGRQGQGSRTHLMSPAMAAAAALTGRLSDVRDLG